MEYLSKIKAQKPPLAIRFSNGGKLLNLEGKQIFTSMLYLDAKRQQTIQLLIEKINNVLKLSHLEQEEELIDNMIEQQDTLLRAMQDWVSYLDSRTKEYVTLYEKLDLLISTQRRKSGFTIKDIRSLNAWNDVTRHSFWILLLILIVILCVHQFQLYEKSRT